VAKERLRFADTLGGRLDERLREALRTLAPNGQPVPAQRLATAQSIARAAAADLRAVAAGAPDAAVRGPL
jgi:hypothetical protein